MKFMQKAFEKQRSLAKQSIIDMKKEMKENEKILNDDSDNKDNEEEKKEKSVNVINTGRMQFTKVKTRKKYIYIYIFYIIIIIIISNNDCFNNNLLYIIL